MPVEVPAADSDPKGMRLWLPMRINHCRKVLLAELEFNTPEAEVLCRVHKLQETWDRNHELVKKIN